MATSPNVIQIPQIREIFACGIQTPGKFCLWNPDSWALESEILLKESGIPLMIGIRNLSSTDQKLESGTWNPQSTVRNRESKTVTGSLDCLTHGELLDSGYCLVDCLRHPSLSVTTSAC